MPQKILWAEVQKETGRWKSRWKIQDLFADPGCSQAVLDFLSSTDVGKIVPTVEEEDGVGKIVPTVEEEDGVGSEASEWELRERQEREEEKRAGALGAENEVAAGEEPPLFLPTPSFMATAGED